MSTIRSFSTRIPRIGSIVTLGATSWTSTLHASAFVPSISIASEPQIPCAHERRSARVPSWCHLISCSASRSRSVGSISTSNSSHQDSSETSGLNRRIRTVRAVRRASPEGGPSSTSPRAGPRTSVTISTSSPSGRRGPSSRACSRARCPRRRDAWRACA